MGTVAGVAAVSSGTVLRCNSMQRLAAVGS